MSRRRVVAKRDILPDPKFGNLHLAKFMNYVMVMGKKSIAERIVYGALDRIKDRIDANPLVVFEQALEVILVNELGLESIEAPYPPNPLYPNHHFS